ncbi:hypothetical protein [Lysobacter capsici]|uniref:hypothetical protein n=1 Tax=Lysobacter capsici TaxID=435897 RepID=UPI00287BA0CD|nr:hypothetical protein [Lysobacter capsici]WND80298.1 hypothetical protein RJ610_23975 [Lysobacter capsici]WND85495.1 hypothetical protein RJ609_23995 [Lysobacter capsici]
MRTKAVDLAFGLKSSKAFKAFKASSRIKSVPPLKRRVTFFCLKQQKSAWIPFGQKVTKEKCFFVNQEPARAVQTQACATRDILSRWRTAHIHVRRPSGVLLFSRVPSFAALDELRGFKPEQKPHGPPIGAAQAATAPLQLRRRFRHTCNVAVAAHAAPTGAATRPR